MKKIYSIDYSSESLTYNRNSNILVILYRFVFLLSLFISSIYFAQETTITGFENMKVSSGANVITKNAEKQEVISKTNISIEKIKIDVEINSDNESIISGNNENKKTNNKETKKIAQKSEPKIIKKIQTKENQGFVFNKNENSGENFSLANFTSKIGFITPSYSSGKYINNVNDFHCFLFYFQTKENTLINYYESKKVESFLFARPPPII